MLSAKHVDVARTKYRLAFSLVKSVPTSGEDHENEIYEINQALKEAKYLCDTAYSIQKAQLSSEHENLKECIQLRQEINKRLKPMKSSTTSQVT